MNEWNDDRPEITKPVETTIANETSTTEGPENNSDGKAEQRRERRFQIKLNSLGLAHDDKATSEDVIKRANAYYDFLRK